MSRQQRLVFLAIAVAIAVVAVIVLAGGEDPETARTPDTTPTATATPEPGDTPQGEETPAATPTPEPTPEVPRIRVRRGEVVGGEAEIAVEQGDRVRFTVSSDVADHVHVHGYDVLRDVGPGMPASFSFEAKIVGVFEVELEESHVLLARLTVNP